MKWTMTGISISLLLALRAASHPKRHSASGWMISAAPFGSRSSLKMWRYCVQTASFRQSFRMDLSRCILMSLPLITLKSLKKGYPVPTYKGFDGYAPIMADIGTEGYLINEQLREGKQYCQCAPDFLRQTIAMCRQITKEPLRIPGFFWNPDAISLSSAIFAVRGRTPGLKWQKSI